MKTKFPTIRRRTPRKLTAGSRRRSPRQSRDSHPFIAPILTVIE